MMTRSDNESQEVINPWCAWAARVVVLDLCVHICVCLFVMPINFFCHSMHVCSNNDTRL